ncbi:hypothetical protein ABT063_27590 [Streptomyces sp. NPDC002838]|uniref:hypothetical protein n=1 Tax=Streptomyces sp. NPDC002838 TaxID=3154436 RepID=UPI00332FE4EB
MSRCLFVENHQDAYGVKRLCQVLELNRSSYYKWRSGAKAREPAEFTDLTPR